MKSQQVFQWQFGGGTALSPWLEWTLLFAAAAAGVALAAWLYRDTLQTLTPRQRLFFVLLRSGFFLALLVCLAGPSRVERTYDSDQDARPLAVVVDHSASMTMPDSAGVSRLSSAIRVWKEAEPAAIQYFPQVRYFSFSGDLSPAADLREAVERSDPGNSTALYSSLEKVLQTAPGGGYGGIVCLTDGLDTTSVASDQMVSAAIQNHTPLYFVAGENRQKIQENLIVRETRVPGRVLRKSEFIATALVEAHTLRERDVPLALWQDGQVLAQTTLHLRAGANVVPWNVPVQSGEPGLMHFSWHLGDPADPAGQETLAATVRVADKDQVGVLFYQGTLDWGYRFIDTALQQDASFSVTGLFSSDLNLTQVVTADASSTLTVLPDSADALQPYRIVVMADAFAQQLSDAQQKALSDYVRAGGGLLFLVSDTKMAQTFSGTALESMLPVVFEPPPLPGQADDSLSEFQDMMHQVGGSNPGSETGFAADALPNSGLAPLQPFAIPAGTTRSEIAQLFNPSGGPEAEIPRFATYAHVASVKAGAQVLAVHPADKNARQEPRALLVAQRFGQGQVTVLLTDALWRWKLSLPSTSQAPEKFWQQLFLALAGPGGTIHFSAQPYYASLGQDSSFSLDGAPGLNPPGVTVSSPAGTPVPAPAVQAGSHAGEWTFRFAPDQPGKWLVRVQDSDGAEIQTLLRVSSVSQGELSGLPPDLDGLRKLAEVTGGAMLNDGTPDAWSSRSAAPQLTVISEHTQPLWNTWAVLLVALAFYAAELVWRRRARLL